MNTRSLRRTRRQVASSLHEVIDKLEDAASVLGQEVDRPAGKWAEIAALPAQLQELRRSLLATVEPYRAPQRYRPYVQVAVLAVVVAAVIAIVMRRRQGAARSTAPAPDQTGYPGNAGDDGPHRPTSATPAPSPEYGAQQE